MKILKKNEVYLATIVKDASIHIVIAQGARLVKVVLTGELLPMHKLGSITEVQSC